MEGRGERIGRSQPPPLPPSAPSAPVSLAEQIRRKLESHKKRELRGQTGLSFDNVNLSADCPVNEINCEVEDQKQKDFEFDLRKSPDIRKSNQQLQKNFTKRISLEEDKKQSKNDLPVMALDFHLPEEEIGKKEIEKLLKNNPATASTTKSRKKILKRSSKIEIETSNEKISSNLVEARNESKQQNLTREDTAKNSAGKMTKTKPILKRSDHFEMSVDKNSVLRSSENMKKVLPKDLNLRGKLLNIPAYNDISFDANFRPVHR